MKRIFLSSILVVLLTPLHAQNYTLTSLVVNSLNDSWCGDIEETNWPFFGCSASPDPYAVLIDGNGNTVYQSATNVDNFSLELVLNIELANFPYTLTIWDEDGIFDIFGANVGSNDDNLGNFIIDGSQTGTFTLSNSGSSISLSILYSYPGCTDVNALNFIPDATINDGSCTYELFLGCTDINALNYNSSANSDDGSCLYFSCPSDITPDADNLFYAPEGSTVIDNNIQLPSGTINYIYQEYIQFYAPIQLDLDGTTIEFNNVIINSISNLPNGLSYQCNSGNCGFSSDQVGCIGLIGIPEESGIFDLSISASVSVSYDLGLLGNVDIDFDVPYSGGNTYLDLAGVDASTINSIVPTITLIVQEDANVFGCINPLAINYNPLANQEDNSCEFLQGCTDSLANNFDPLAVLNDDSCDYSIICDGFWSFIELKNSSFTTDISWSIVNADGDSLINSNEFYYYATSNNYELCLESDQTYYLNSNQGDWLGAEIDISISCDSGTLSILNESPSNGELTQYFFFTSCSPVYGCTDELALNFDTLANIDNQSCLYPIFGCTDFDAVNYNPLADLNDNSCTYFECQALSSSEAGFYPPDGSSFSEDSTAVYLPNAQLNEFYDQNLQFYAEDSISISGLEIGFVSAKILNVNNMPTGMYYQTSSTDSTFRPNITGCLGLFGTPEQSGVYNLSIEATVTVEILETELSFDLPYQGGVLFLDLVFSDGDYSPLNDFIPAFVIQVDEALDPPVDVYGCLDELASNFDSIATLDDSSCVYPVNGCSDELAFNFDSNATSSISDSSCIFSQTLVINSGWSLISTYIQPEVLDISNVFSPLASNIVILKNNVGSAFIPEYNFNGIGDMLAGQGYQIKLNSDDQLTIVGDQLYPESTPIELILGWNLIAYLRQFPANTGTVFDDMLVNGSLVIVKDSYGNAYLPEWNFNGIGDMVSGKAYQLKTSEPHTLIYLSNDQEY